MSSFHGRGQRVTVWRLLNVLLPVWGFTAAVLLQVWASAAIVESSPSDIVRPLGILALAETGLAMLLLHLLSDPEAVAGLLIGWAFLLLTPVWSFPLMAAIGAGVALFSCLLGKVFGRKVTLRYIGRITFVGLTASFLGFAGGRAKALAYVPWASYRQHVTSFQEDSIALGATMSGVPDIYYIVPDAYVRSDVLRELYGYDNAQFIGYLREKGFIVPTHNHSNYGLTFLSLPSTLNMEYMDHVWPDFSGEAGFWWLVRPWLANSQVARALMRQGYRFVALPTDWAIANLTDVGQHIPLGRPVLSRLENALLTVTPLRAITPILGEWVFVPSFDSHRELIYEDLEALAEVPALPSPKFVFVHLLCPHPPFVIGEDGAPAPSVGDYEFFSFVDGPGFPGSRDEYVEGYVGQVQGLNKLLERTIDALLAGSTAPPIIIIQADHGARLYTDFGSAENTCIWEGFSPFAAYYLPGVDYSEMDFDHISSVNVFRFVLRHYFDADLPPLADRAYFWQRTPSGSYVDVTERLERPCELPTEREEGLK